MEAVENEAFRHVRDALAKKSVWTWIEGGPQPPRVLNEHVRFSFHPGFWRTSNGHGFISMFVSCKDVDGRDVIDDICNEIVSVFSGGLKFGKGVWTIVVNAAEPRSGRAHAAGWFHQDMHCGWTIGAQS